MRYYDSFVACDIETTGFSIKKGSRIIEIGAVKVISGSAHSVYSTLVGPKRYISEEITELTNISADMLEGKPEITEVMREFLDFAGELPLLFHSAMFDMRFIRPACKEHLGADIKNIVLDTCDLAKKHRKFLPFTNGPDQAARELASKLNSMFAPFEDREARLKIADESEPKYRNDSCSLGNLSRVFGIRNVSAHTALSDAVAAAKLYFMLWYYIRKYQI